MWPSFHTLFQPACWARCFQHVLNLYLLVWLEDVTTDAFATRSPFVLCDGCNNKDHRLRNIRIVSCALQSIKEQQIYWSKHDESPWYMSCWIVEPMPVDQRSKMTCLGRDSIWQYGMPWWVFLANCALHSGGLSFLWISFHRRQLLVCSWCDGVLLLQRTSVPLAMMRNMFGCNKILVLFCLWVQKYQKMIIDFLAMGILVWSSQSI
jgi:hypothetical protein